MKRRTRPRLLALAALLAYLASAAAYLASVPPWEAPDEPWHLAYAETLAQGRLPTAADTYEFHHPPLYYAYLAGAMSLAGQVSLPRSRDNPRYPLAAAAYLHPAGEPLGAVRLARTSNLAFGLLAVALTWAAGRAAFPRRARVAVGAAWLMALWPQFGFITSVFSNDGLVVVWGAAALYALCRLIRQGASSRNGLGQPTGPSRPANPSLAVSLGGVLFLGLITKLTVLGLLPAMALGAYWCWRPTGRHDLKTSRGEVQRRWTGRLASMSLLVGLLLALVVYARWLPGTMAALGGRVSGAEAVGGRGAGSLTALAMALPTLIQSSWAEFGWLNVTVPRLLIAFAIAGVLWAATRLAWYRVAWSAPADRRVVAVAATVIAGTSMAALVNLRADLQPQGRLLFGALPALSLLLGLASDLRPEKLRLGAAFGPASFLALIAALTTLIAAGIVLPDAYAPSRGAEETVALRLVPGPGELRPLPLRFENETATLTYEIPRPTTDWGRLALPITGLKPGSMITVRRRGPGHLGEARLEVGHPDGSASWLGVSLTEPPIGGGSEPLAVELVIPATAQQRRWLGLVQGPVYVWASASNDNRATVKLEDGTIANAVAIIYARSIVVEESPADAPMSPAGRAP